MVQSHLYETETDSVTVLLGALEHNQQNLIWTSNSHCFRERHALFLHLAMDVKTSSHRFESRNTSDRKREGGRLTPIISGNAMLCFFILQWTWKTSPRSFESRNTSNDHKKEGPTTTNSHCGNSP
jgi:hypothetical protein